MDSTQELEKSYHFDLYRRLPVTLVKGKGIYVWDSNGDKYVDFLSGIAVNALGHCHPAMIKAIKTQSQKLIHVSNIYYTEPQARLAKLLCSISGFERVFFCIPALKLTRPPLNWQEKQATLKVKRDLLSLLRVLSMADPSHPYHWDPKNFNKGLILYLTDLFNFLITTYRLYVMLLTKILLLSLLKQFRVKEV
jgi:hypothetical protein